MKSTQRTLIKETINLIDQEVLLKGWVHGRRDMGKIIFIDLRDASGLIQVVFSRDHAEALSLANSLRSEFVISLKGKVRKRPEKMINPNLLTGTVEIEAEELKVLNEAKTLPFEIDKNTKEIKEEARMKYRYLDLRSERMKKNILLRSRLLKEVINFLFNKDFTYIETPYITKGTPEGSREYIIPSRLQRGQFYVLPQSPQQFKQLLMVAGFEKYFQLARCFRDEDQRGDRQAEFTQIDLEMSFVSEKDVFQIIEELMIDLIKKITPEKKIKEIPFPVLTYEEAMKKYQSDKPDLRTKEDELAFSWVIDFPLFEYSEKEKKLVSAHHPFTMPKEEDMLLLDKDPRQAKGFCYDLVLNGYEIWSGSIRIHQRDLQNKIFKILGLSDEEIKKRFGHLLEAFEYGTPPHGGIACGFDRLAMVLAGEPNIREVIAFPKTGDGYDLMMGAPSELEEERLKEVYIQTIKEK